MTSLDSQLLVGILLIGILVLVLWIIRLELKLKKLTRGTDKANLETGLADMQAHARDFGAFKFQIEKQLQNVEGRVRKSVQHVQTMRFDPFKGTGSGGGQSFATAFLNESGDGVVISTIHTRERVGVFSKPIKNGTSEFELTPEEKQVITDARNIKK